MADAAPGAVFVCHGDPKACWCCDHRTAEPIRTAEGHVYCSIECHDDWEEHLAVMDARRRCCDECGYDQQEHDPRSCSRATASDFQREGLQR